MQRWLCTARVQSRCELLASAVNVAVRSGGTRWKTGDGIRHVEMLEKARAEALAAAGKPENPLDYTIFGNKRKPKEDIFHYTDRKSGRGYSDFGDEIYSLRPRIYKPVRKYFYINFVVIIVGTILLLIDFQWLLNYGKRLTVKFRPEAATIEPADTVDVPATGMESVSELTEEEEEEEEAAEGAKKKKKRKIGFRERRVIEYENRIRLYSAPDKIFRYFATLKVPNDDVGSRPYDVYMTPKDFVRSITPGVLQPRNLGLDKFKWYEPNKSQREFADPNSIFRVLGEHGLISFSDYLFLMTLLSTSPKEFELAFRIFDLNGDGELDKEEFERVQELVMSQTSVGQRYRDHAAGGVVAKKQMNSAISSYFFGTDGSKKLSIDKFLDFQERLHRDTLKIECERRDPESMPEGIISEVAFADLLLVHACLSEVKQRIMLKRVKRRWGSGTDPEDKPGVTLEEVNAFFSFLYYIEDVDLALHFYNLAGASIDGEVLKTVARKIAHCEISDHVVDIVVTLFDDNQDGELSNKEFVAIMKKRMKRGLERPRDTGLVKLLDAMAKCARIHVSDALFSSE